jgi:hypothetical protein
MSARRAKRPAARRVRVGSRHALHQPTLIRPFGPPSPNGRRNLPPGPKQFGYYGAFVLDPDGNNIEAVYRSATQPGQA